MNGEPNSKPETKNLKLLILVGPTGAGKTSVAVELCEILNGEIISADSMQIYRGLDIGTAKATPAEQARAPHHLINILNPGEEYSAARWARDASRAVKAVRSRDKTPIICGGTGFYIRALLFPETIASTPPDQKLRTQLGEIAAREGHEVLHARLQQVDPGAASRLHPNDAQRVIRALEVALSPSPSNPLSQELGEREGDEDYTFAAFGLHVPREVLYARLNARVEAMLAAGFMDELKTLIAAGYGKAAALQNLGYKQMRIALEEPSKFDECLKLWKRDTRRYAKRQMTWFRHQIPVQGIEMENSLPREIAELIAHQWRELHSKERGA